MTARLSVGLVVAALLACWAPGCSGSSTSAASKRRHGAFVEEGPFGRAADQVWLFRPRRRAKDIVIFVHGAGDRTEATPQYHRPWLEHLAARGSVVVYPRYEIAHAPDALKHLVAGVRRGMRQIDSGRLPVLAIGYSRGARLAVEYAALAAGVGPVPDAVLSVFPSPLIPGEPVVDLRGIDPQTQILILVGDHDNVVGDSGARELSGRLATAGITHGRVEFVSSHNGFIATHLSVLEHTPGARAAYWARADRLIGALTSVRRSR